MGSDEENRHRKSKYSFVSLFYSNRHQSAYIMASLMISCSIAIIWFMSSSLLLWWIPVQADTIRLLNDEELIRWIDDLRGDDMRLMRWDATRHTRKRQSQGACDDLPNALHVILSTTTMENSKGLACEYATFCVTNNPKMRAQLSDQKDIHEAIINLVLSKDNHVSAMACHLIYIATFANTNNHQIFIQKGAVSNLATVIKSSNASKVQVMWAAAALQNLAASYCDTEGDGRCYWKWKFIDNEYVLVLESKKYTILSDGETARQQIQNDDNLIQRLLDLTCTGPVSGDNKNNNRSNTKSSTEQPHVGDNAIVGRHDEAPTIVAWAATGVFKNVAISANSRIKIEPSIQCICRMAHSPDWLEENKGQGAIHHLRPYDPCWFQDDNAPQGKLCVDDVFRDKEGYTCSDYGRATKEECLATDTNGKVMAKDACCGCGGGKAEKSWSMRSSKRSEL
jgi:hypothetical protein